MLDLGPDDDQLSTHYADLRGDRAFIDAVRDVDRRAPDAVCAGAVENVLSA
ncbi:MAG: hypothetical protein R2856_14125 [Caldilineaceae bacterium]